MNLISEAARDAVLGKYPLPGPAGLCLTLVRLVIERALNLGDHGLYSLLPLKYTQSPVASDAEQAFRQLGYHVAGDPEPGDIGFGDLSPNNPGSGHCWVYFRGDDGMVYALENTAYPRGTVMYGATRITPLSSLDPVTTLVRFPPAQTERIPPGFMPALPKVPIRVFRKSGGYVGMGTLVGSGSLPGLKVYLPDPYFREIV